MDTQQKQAFIHLFERVGEPLYFSPRGRDSSRISYQVPSSTITCPELQHASGVYKFSNAGRSVQIRQKDIPDLSELGRLCPRSHIFSYFNPNHRRAANRLRDIFNQQQSLDDLLSVASGCRDNVNVNCKLWINAMTGCLLTNQRTRNIELPAVWEVMPDQFFSGFTIRQAFRQAELPPQDRGVIQLAPQTGRNTNRENRLAYWREDVGLNSHHWHWHLVYRQEDPQREGRRKGELFYYMHHQMIARYDCERLSHGLPRVIPLDIDSNPVIKEGYFNKLTDTTSGSIWGVRQDNTRIVDINRSEDPALQGTPFLVVRVQELRTWRDRVYEAIDTGTVLNANNTRTRINVDVLGDMLEASNISPNPQFYGQGGVHNVGHVLIAHSHDPNYHHFENVGVMGDTTTAMRDPVFYRWHKYIDDIFDRHKRTLTPYAVNGGDFPLAWTSVTVQSISVQHTTFGSSANALRTFFMRSAVDLSRGLDFLRRDENSAGPIWLRIQHLNHAPFRYNITVRSTNPAEVQATVRIYMAPRFNEQGEQILIAQQRKLFIEMDKFVVTLRPGNTDITRDSTQSAVTVPWEQTFRDLERSMELPNAQQSICGCGFPQHLLLPRGNPQGQVYDLVVFLTNTTQDTVANTGGVNSNRSNGNCRESLSFCGRLDQAYPDAKPMGYPFDREPFSVQTTGGLVPVRSLDEYKRSIPNMESIQIRITHDANQVLDREDNGPANNMRVVSGDPNMTGTFCSSTGARASAPSSSRVPAPINVVATQRQPPTRTSPTVTQPRPGQNNFGFGGGRGSPGSSPPPQRRPQYQPAGWNTTNVWNRQRSQSPPSPSWTHVHRPANQWGWGG